MISGFNHFEDNIKTFQFVEFPNSITYDSNMTVDEFNSFFENGKCLEYRFNIDAGAIKGNGTLIMNPINMNGNIVISGNMFDRSLIQLRIVDAKVEAFAILV